MRRLKVLVNAGILVLPELSKPETRGGIVNRPAFDELSFAFFVAWLYTSIWSRTASFRASWVLLPGTNETILSLGRLQFPLVVPGTATTPAIFIDDEFLACEVDRTKTAVERKRQILCPVLNRVRSNLAHRVDRVTVLPPASRDCCGSAKALLWGFMRGDRDAASAAVGGQAIPIALDSTLATAFATGLEATSTDLGAVFEETLLVYALFAAGATMGIPHFSFTQPVESHEIDFAIYDTRGHRHSDDWESVIGAQSLAVWEVTCGHMAEEPELGDTRSRPGADHPRNKLVNFLALSTLGFAELRFHYLSVLQPTDGISPATVRALERTPGFDYWCLQSEVPNLSQEVIESLDAGVNAASLRDWHHRIVQRVEMQATVFAEAIKQRAPIGDAAT